MLASELVKTTTTHAARHFEKGDAARLRWAAEVMDDTTSNSLCVRMPPGRSPTQPCSMPETSAGLSPRGVEDEARIAQVRTKTASAQGSRQTAFVQPVAGTFPLQAAGWPCSTVRCASAEVVSGTLPSPAREWQPGCSVQIEGARGLMPTRGPTASRSTSRKLPASWHRSSSPRLRLPTMATTLSVTQSLLVHAAIQSLACRRRGAPSSRIRPDSPPSRNGLYRRTSMLGFAPIARRAKTPAEGWMSSSRDSARARRARQPSRCATAAGRSSGPRPR